MSTRPLRTVKRAPRVGDTVRVIASGNLHRVTDVLRDGPFGPLIAVGTESLETGLPNAFNLPEVATIAAADARTIPTRSTL